MHAETTPVRRVTPAFANAVENCITFTNAGCKRKCRFGKRFQVQNFAQKIGVRKIGGRACKRAGKGKWQQLYNAVDASCIRHGVGSKFYSTSLWVTTHQALVADGGDRESTLRRKRLEQLEIALVLSAIGRK